MNFLSPVKNRDCQEPDVQATSFDSHLASCYTRVGLALVRERR